MIKINLLKNSGGSSNLNSSVSNMSGLTFHSSGQEDHDFVEPKSVVLKVATLIALPFVLFVVDLYLSSQSKSELQALSAKVQTMQKQVASYGPKADSVKKFQSEKKSLENRINLIRELSNQRLKLIKTLDALHNIVPEKSWLTNINMDEEGFSLSGMATDDFVVSALIQNLDESIFYNQVRLESSEEAKMDLGNIRKFKVSGRLGD